MDTELERYLNDHLTGAAGAILLVEKLIDRVDEPEERGFFSELKGKIEGDRDFLKGMMDSIGSEPGVVARAAGNVGARFGLFKLMWEGLEPGKLGMFEALEMLSLGIHGKRLLWLALKEVACWFPEWECIDFGSLELDAIQQREDLERWRLEAARDTLASVRRRASAETFA